MTPEQKHIARVLFKLKILTCDGQAYEDLFTQVMTASNVNFIQIKPQGSFGDRKNDGFDKTTGTYYQVYAPENLLTKENKTLDKLKEDFSGLFTNWNNQVPIQSFYYVLNDKFQGVYVSIVDALNQTQTLFNIPNMGPFLAKDLEHIVFQLDDSVIYELVGYVSPNQSSENIQLAALGDVVTHLVNNMTPIHGKGKLVVPDFDEKIEFNKLSETVGEILKSGNYQTHALESFFRNRSTTLKEELRSVFATLYAEALTNLKDYQEEDKADIAFYDILKKSYPNQKLVHEQAVIVLMAYYFEACDIFEEPIKEPK